MEETVHIASSIHEPPVPPLERASLEVGLAIVPVEVGVKVEVAGAASGLTLSVQRRSRASGNSRGSSSTCTYVLLAFAAVAMFCGRRLSREQLKRRRLSGL